MALVSGHQLHKQDSVTSKKLSEKALGVATALCAFFNMLVICLMFTIKLVSLLLRQISVFRDQNLYFILNPLQVSSDWLRVDSMHVTQKSKAFCAMVRVKGFANATTSGLETDAEGTFLKWSRLRVALLVALEQKCHLDKALV